MKDAQAILALLASEGIAHSVHHHPAFFTVAEGLAYEAGIPGAHCRNLFLKDKTGALLLVTALNDTKVDLKRLTQDLGLKRLSFGAADLLVDVLGVTPGSVTPLAVLNDTRKQVRLILDASMREHDIINVHPLINTMTVSLRVEDLIEFVKRHHGAPLFYDFSQADQAA